MRRSPPRPARPRGSGRRAPRGRRSVRPRLRHPADGEVTNDLRWEVSGPWHVLMSEPTAAGIARRVGPEEFAPPGSHPPANTIPCQVAQAVAFTGAEAWANWTGNTGAFGVGWFGEAPGPYLGLFHCMGVSRNDGGAKETCVHRPDRHAGRIKVSFTITAAPTQQ